MVSFNQQRCFIHDHLSLPQKTAAVKAGHAKEYRNKHPCALHDNSNTGLWRQIFNEKNCKQFDKLFDITAVRLTIE
jgi:hypothetical protein